MLHLSIPIPTLPGQQEIDIEMKINGQKQQMRFRVEFYRWDDCKTYEENRIECIRTLVRDYGDDWMIYHIGLPTDEYVPLTFVRTSDWERQRQLIADALHSS